MVAYVEENPLITLAEIRRKVQHETGVTLAISTIHRHLDGQLYTVKKVLPEPVAMNSMDNTRYNEEGRICAKGHGSDQHWQNRHLHR